MPLTSPADRHAAAQLFPGVSRIVLGILDEIVFPGEEILGVENATGMRVLVENWTEEDRFLNINTRWVPGTKIDTVRFSKDFQEFQLRFGAIQAEETEAFLELSTGDGLTVAPITRQRYAAFGATFLRRFEEVERADLLTTTANWGTNFTDLTAAPWGGAGDILADVDSEAITIRQNVGVGKRSLRLYLPPLVWDQAKFDAGFVAYRKSGGKMESPGLGTLQEMTEYLGINRAWSDDTGIQVIESRGGAREPVWKRDAILYAASDLVPSAAEWGVPRLGFVQRNKGPGAARAYFLDERRVWRFPWLGRERAFLVTPGAGHLFKNAVPAV
jgi:hypothetical protein